MIALKTVLVATDFSEPSEIAVRYGRALAEAFHASLHILHVVPDSMALPWATMADGLAMADVQRRWEREANERLRRMLPECEPQATHATLVTRAGDAVRQIVSYAAETTRVADPTKVIYGQAFALYALSEYARLTNDETVLARATELFEVVDRHAHDGTFGGYFEVFERDWSSPPASKASPIGGPPGAKLMNTHLHLLEAIAEYYRASASPPARERLFELVAIEGSTVVRKELTACTDEYRRDWTPILEGSAANVSYGHDVENVWLLSDAVQTLGQSNALWLDLYRRLFDYSYRYGYDRQQGGFFSRGPFNTPADEREKIWWVQAEGLVSALTMFTLTRESTYARVFEETLRWIDQKQTDWRVGEWYAEVLPDGSTRGVKGDRWKEGYHNGRALLESIRLIESLTDER